MVLAKSLGVLPENCPETAMTKQSTSPRSLALGGAYDTLSSPGVAVQPGGTTTVCGRFRKDTFSVVGSAEAESCAHARIGASVASATAAVASSLDVPITCVPPR